MVILLLLPLLSVLLLLLNPVLLGIFRWRDINLQKFHFWAMVTAGASWVISLAAFLIGPSVYYHPTSQMFSGLFPMPALALDGITSALIMAVAAVAFYETLKGTNQPQEIARITAVGGVCAAGLLSDSIYTLLYAWAAMEGVCLLCSILDQDSRQSLRRKYLAVILRLFSPLVLVYAAIVSGGEDAGWYFSALPPEAGLLVILAGAVGFVGWAGILTPGGSQPRVPGRRSYAELLPGVIGLALIIRGGAVGNLELELPQLSLLASLALVGTAAGILLARPASGWMIGGVGLIAGSALQGQGELSLVWSLIFLLAGLILRDHFKDRHEGILALVAGILGVFCMPFLPSWRGTELFGGGFPGGAFAAAYGLAGGGMLAGILERIRTSEIPDSRLAPTRIIAAAALLISLFAPSLAGGLLPSSLVFLSAPKASWLPLPLMVLLALLGSRIPRLKTSLPGNALRKTGDFSVDALDVAARMIDGVVSLVTGLFEGDGGLIWALVIGFLIITLISLGGG